MSSEATLGLVSGLPSLMIKALFKLLLFREVSEGVALCTGFLKVSSLHLEGWDKEGGRETQKGGDMGICICIAESLCYTAET